MKTIKEFEKESEKTLLENAAKAVGLRMEICAGIPCVQNRVGAWRPWNPLRKKGQALKLAVDLKLSIMFMNDSNQPLPWLRIEDSKKGGWTHEGPQGLFHKDPVAATCRAIVMAAAKVGETM